MDSETGHHLMRSVDHTAKVSDKILLVEDDPSTRELLQEVLTGEGFESRVAANGREALKVLEQFPASLVITDIMMPDHDGLELIFEMQKMHPEVKTLVISGGGAFGAGKYLRLAAKAGASWTLPKPFSRTEFLQAVTETLRT